MASLGFASIIEISTPELKLMPTHCPIFQKCLKVLEDDIISPLLTLQVDIGKFQWQKKIKRKKFPTPKNVSTLRSFLGLTNYYQRFNPDYATRAYPFTKLIRMKQTFEWKQEQQEVMDKLKQLLTSEPIMQYSDF